MWLYHFWYFLLTRVWLSHFQDAWPSLNDWPILRWLTHFWDSWSIFGDWPTSYMIDPLWAWITHFHDDWPSFEWVTHLVITDPILRWLTHFWDTCPTLGMTDPLLEWLTHFEMIDPLLIWLTHFWYDLQWYEYIYTAALLLPAGRPTFGIPDTFFSYWPTVHMTHSLLA